MRTIEQVFREIESVPDFSGHKIDSVRYKNGYGDTPLHIAAVWGDIEAIKLLVSAGADIDATGETGFTPLQYAVEHNKPEAIELLIKLGAKLINDKNGNSALELAETLGNKEAIDAIRKGI